MLESLQLGHFRQVHQPRISDLAITEVDHNYFTLVIPATVFKVPGWGTSGYYSTALYGQWQTFWADSFRTQTTLCTLFYFLRNLWVSSLWVSSGFNATC
ncbi:MAG: hypothetical protein CMJ81_04790 [Planctomycetaceae bacterium]|nr:hypothetical protein [Planctomycetaceae bacterium]